MALIGIISDIHSNLEALKAVYERLLKHGVERIYCTGDIIGYGASPNSCVEFIYKYGIRSIRGNHDQAVIDNSGLPNSNTFAQLAIRWTQDELKEKNLMFLRRLPDKLIDGDIFFVHGSPRDHLNEYVFPDMPDDTLQKLLSKTRKKVLVIGHTHKPFIKQLKQGLIINAGSVGQPRDKDKRACYILFDTKERKAWIKRVDYNIDKSAEKILNAHLPSILASRLYDGT